MPSPDFTSRLSKKQAIAVFAWLPVHVFLLPLLATALYRRGLLDSIWAQLFVYAVGAVYMILVLLRFLRRDFDALCDRPLRVLLLIFGGYWAIFFGETLIFLLFEKLSIAGSGENNEAVTAMIRENLGPTAAMAVFLAPFVEEPLFRAGFFGCLRRKSRLAAYVVSALLFGLYHVWSEALYDPSQLLYLLEYLPSGLALAYVYERSDSVWGCIFLHMLCNGVSVLAVAAS